MKSKLTKATDVSATTRKIVLERDHNRCIFCKTSNKPLTMAHIIPRSASGLGNENNLVTACSMCHYKLDHTLQRAIMMKYAVKYLDSIYQESWDERKFKKGE